MTEKNHKILEKALSMLEYVAVERGNCLTEICNAVDIPKSTAHSLLNTFVNMGYMKKDRSGQYSIDIKLFELGNRYVNNDSFLQAAREVLDAIVVEVDETAHLAILDGTDAVYVCKCDCSHTVRMVSFVGKRLPAHASAIGKALLSGYTDEEIRALYKDKQLERLTENSIRSIDVLLEQIADIRRQGFAKEHEESTPGVECIAMPIIGRNSGKVEAAVSISVPVFRSEGNVEKYRQPLLDARRSLEILL